MIYVSYSRLSKELKYGIKILVGQVVFEVMDQNIQNVLHSNFLSSMIL